MGAGVGGLVKAGERAGTGGHDDGGLGVPGPDAAEVEFCCVGRRGAALPVLAAVSGVENGSVRPAGLGDLGGDGVDSPQSGGGAAGLHLPRAGGGLLGGEQGSGKKRQQQSDDSEKPGGIAHAGNGNAGVP